MNNRVILVFPNFAFYLILYPVVVLILALLGMEIIDSESLDVYAKIKLWLIVYLTPICIFLMHLFKVIVDSSGICILYGVIRKDGRYFGWVESKATWKEIIIEANELYDRQLGEFYFGDGKAKNKIVLKFQRKVGILNKMQITKDIYTYKMNKNWPKWIYGKKYLEDFQKQMELIYKYGKKTSMTPSQAEAWKNTFGPSENE